MTLDILICTIDEGITHVPSVLLPPADGIRYVVSMQYTSGKYLDCIPHVLSEREDVTLTTLEGRGLSRNRNNAIDSSTADIILIADDDNRYTAEGLQAIISTYEMDESADVILFRSNLHKHYPAKVETYSKAFSEGYYPSSVEMTFRRGIGITFDERFGLGSGMYCSGEEAVFLKDCEDEGLTILLYPLKIVDTPAVTSSSDFIHDADLQIAKGAVFLYLFGRREAIWRTIKEAAHHLLHSHANPFTIIRNMMKGIIKA